MSISVGLNVNLNVNLNWILELFILEFGAVLSYRALVRLSIGGCAMQALCHQHYNIEHIDWL
jgi:hypothetical protein